MNVVLVGCNLLRPSVHRLVPQVTPFTTSLGGGTISYVSLYLQA